MRDPNTASAVVDEEEELVGFLQREKVDVVIVCDMAKSQVVRYETDFLHLSFGTEIG